MSGYDHEAMMRIALEEAVRSVQEGNSGVGSIIVRDGEVIARGRNLVMTQHDITAHAETVALREAGAALGTVDLSGCTLYTTYEPCPMCCTAILLAGITDVVIGARPAPEERRWPAYTIEWLIDALGMSHMMNVHSGVLAKECAEVRP